MIGCLIVAFIRTIRTRTRWSHFSMCSCALFLICMSSPEQLTVDEISTVISDIIYLHRISFNKLTIAGFVDSVLVHSTPSWFLPALSTTITFAPSFFNFFHSSSSHLWRYLISWASVSGRSMLFYIDDFTNTNNTLCAVLFCLFIIICRLFLCNFHYLDGAFISISAMCLVISLAVSLERKKKKRKWIVGTISDDKTSCAMSFTAIRFFFSIFFIGLTAVWFTDSLCECRRSFIPGAHHTVEHILCILIANLWRRN